MSTPQPLVLHDIRAAIIDLDGTMLDTAQDIQVAINRMRKELHLAPLAIDVVTNFVGKGTENLVRRVLAVDYDAAEVEQHYAQALPSYLRHYQAINGDYSTLYPEVREGLQALQAKKVRLACVTNKPIALTIPLLEKKRAASLLRHHLRWRFFAEEKAGPSAITASLRRFRFATTASRRHRRLVK